MGRPAVKGTVDKTARPIRTSMINQSADNAQTPVGIAFLEEERIGRKVPVKFDLARMMGILLTAFESLQTLPERAVADAFGVLHYLIVVLLTHDFHNNQILEFCLFPHFGVLLFQKDDPLSDIPQQRLSVADRHRQGIHAIYLTECSRCEAGAGTLRVEKQLTAQLGKGNAEELSAAFQPSENRNGTSQSYRVIFLFLLPLDFRRQAGDLRHDRTDSPSVQRSSFRSLRSSCNFAILPSISARRLAHSA